MNEKKIFLIGSSQVEPLNPGYIHDDLLRNNLNFTVYNLGIGGDKPKEREKTIDWIISAKPSLVVYGVGDRDFPIYDSPVIASQVSESLNLHLEQNWLFKQFQNINDGLFFLDSPKLDFLTFVFGNNSNQPSGFRIFYSDPNEYPRSLETGQWIIADDTTLEIQSQQSRLHDIFPLEENLDLIAFKKMISKFHENNIDVIVYVTPQERHRLEKIPYPVQFTATLQNISKEYPYVPIYSLWDKYADMHIWKDYTHVSNNSMKTSRIYSDDVAKMIIEYFPSSVTNSLIQNDTDHPPKFDYALDSHQGALQ